MKTYQICSCCALDTTVPDIRFDTKGICNFCHDRNAFMAKDFAESYTPGKLKALIAEVKQCGQGKEYDCVIGLSGGVDSSYVAYEVTRLGLRPFAVHLDNGGDAPEATSNISGIVDSLSLPFQNTKADLVVFKRIQVAYYRASVLGIDNFSDHAILALLWHTAARLGVKYIIVGDNYSTESMLPGSWRHDAYDLVNIKDICHRFGATLGAMPTISNRQLLSYRARRIRIIRLLNYYDYRKAEAKEVLKREVGWKDYGGKHCENIYTRFAQCYMLPVKFNIDKRKYHLSSLIRSGQMSRDEALKQLAEPPYEREQFERDLKFILDSLGLTKEQFDEIMLLPVKNHTDYKVGWLTNWASRLPEPAKSLARKIIKL